MKRISTTETSAAASQNRSSFRLALPLACGQDSRTSHDKKFNEPHVSKVSRNTILPESWGSDCSAWRLLAQPDLAVAEEVMPPGTTEKRHIHHRARQFFYVLSGTLSMEREGGTTVALAPGEGLEMPPNVAHRAHNAGGETVRFLVISAPTTKGDRVDLE